MNIVAITRSRNVPIQSNPDILDLYQEQEYVEKIGCDANPFESPEKAHIENDDGRCDGKFDRQDEDLGRELPLWTGEISISTSHCYMMEDLHLCRSR